MIPDKLRTLFQENASTFKEVSVPKQMRDQHAIFKINGSDETFGLRREYLHGFPASDETANPEINAAREDLGAAIRKDFIAHLTRKDVALVLHAESLQKDIVRLTFQSPEKLNKKAFGFVLLTSEINKILKNEKVSQTFSDSTLRGGMDMALATDHNNRLLKALARGYVPGCSHTLDAKSDAPIVEHYVTASFELALPKLSKS